MLLHWIYHTPVFVSIRVSSENTMEFESMIVILNLQDLNKPPQCLKEQIFYHIASVKYYSNHQKRYDYRGI